MFAGNQVVLLVSGNCLAAKANDSTAAGLPPNAELVDLHEGDENTPPKFVAFHLLSHQPNSLLMAA
jgi:hypothetical protein